MLTAAAAIGVIGLALSACATGGYGELAGAVGVPWDSSMVTVATTELILVESIPVDVVDWGASGDTLHAVVDASAEQYRTQFGSAKTKMLQSGIIIVALQSISAALLGNIDHEQTKRDTGIGFDIGSALVGGYQAWQGIKKDPASYYRAAQDVLGKWQVARIEGAGDDNKLKTAYAELVQDARGLKRDYEDWADFEYPPFIYKKMAEEDEEQEGEADSDEDQNVPEHSRLEN